MKSEDSVMRAAKWRNSTNPHELLQEMWRQGIVERKWRLFACACCRRAVETFRDPETLAALEVAERYADGLADDGERMLAREALRERGHPDYVLKGSQLAEQLLYPQGFRQEGTVCELLNHTLEHCRECGGTGELYTSHRFDCYKCNGSGWVKSDKSLSYAEMADVAREIFGDPFEAVRLPELTPEVLAIARGAYDLRTPRGYLDNDRLAVLSDALEDAGCPAYVVCPNCRGTGAVEDDGDGDGWVCPKEVRNPLLEHLRSAGPHHPGCFVLDHILNKR